MVFTFPRYVFILGLQLWSCLAGQIQYHAGKTADLGHFLRYQLFKQAVKQGDAKSPSKVASKHGDICVMMIG